MPWNDNANPGPWGAPQERGEERPPPRPPQAPPPSGPDLEEWLRRAQQRWRALVTRPALQPMRGSMLAAAAVALLAVWSLSGIYVIGAGEKAAVTRFGVFQRLDGPGLAYHLPAPIEHASRIDLTTIRKTQIGDDDARPTLTADGQLARVAFTVSWRVADPVAFLYRNRDAELAVRQAAQGAVRIAAGQESFAALAGGGRGAAQAQAAATTQAILDREHAGVRVEDVQIDDVRPPDAAMATYQDLAQARQDAQAALADAQAYRTRTLADADAESAKLLQSAQTYREQAVLDAQGEAARFGPVEAQYRRAPALTRERLYIQTMQRVLSHAKVVIIDGKRAGTPVMLPPQAYQPSGSPAAASPPPAAGAGK